MIVDCRKPTAYNTVNSDYGEKRWLSRHQGQDSRMCTGMQSAHDAEPAINNAAAIESMLLPAGLR